jgi:hypothetical protein
MRHNEAACLQTVKGKPVMLEGVRATGELRGPMLEMAVDIDEVGTELLVAAIVRPLRQQIEIVIGE